MPTAVMPDGATLHADTVTDLAQQTAEHLSRGDWAEPDPAPKNEMDQLARLVYRKLCEAMREGCELVLHDCGHFGVVRGCGGCDPGAVEYVIDDAKPGVLRPFDPARDINNQGA